MKGFTIGEKREERIESKPGPGQYNHELADTLTKSKSPNINLGSSPSRPGTFAVSGHEHAASPGQYDDGIRFNTGVKGFKIGEKREVPIASSAGPGTCNPEIADTLTKTRTPNINLGSSPSRPRTNAVAGHEHATAPG